MDTASTSTSRRRVVQGIAWAAPAVAMTAAAPAFAASKCTPGISDYGGGPDYSWGVVTARDTTTMQVLQLGAGNIKVGNLPPGVTVASMTVDQYIQQRNGQTTRGPGAFFPGNPSVLINDIGWAGDTSAGTLTPLRPTPNRAVTGTSTYSKFTIQTANAFPVVGSGWDATITATNGLTAQFEDASATAWRLRYSWTAANSKIATYTAIQGTDCFLFDSQSSGRFNITYKDVPTSRPTDWWVNMGPAIRAEVTVKLSSGTVLNRFVTLGARTR